MFSTTTSADRFSLQRDRSPEDPRLPLPQHLAAGHSLPRHLLVSLAGITAEVTALQQRCVDTPQLHAPLATILGRLDGLVDSIYQHAADPAAANGHGAAGHAVGPQSDARPDVPAAHSLPRHLLVSLAEITADVTALQQRRVDTPQFDTPLATILGRLDGLVDSIHQHAADPAAPNGLGADGHTVGSASDARAGVPVDVAVATSLTPSPTPVDEKEERVDDPNGRPLARSSMIDLDELDRLMQGRLRTTVEIYYEARHAFLDASQQAEAEQGLGIMLPMSRMSSADDVIEMSQWLVGPWVALVEKSITLDEAQAQIAIMDDLSKAAQRESMMRWLASKRGPDTPTFETVLIAAGRRFGMGDPAPWPADAAWDDPHEDGA